MSNYIECQNMSQWVLDALPNKQYIYYTGYHASDTLLSNELRKLAWDYARQGKIYLVQRRAGESYFHYIAIRASSPPKQSLIPYIRERDSDFTAHQRRYTKRKLEPKINKTLVWAIEPAGVKLNG